MKAADRIWRFIRGNESNREFEQWLYRESQSAGLELLLGKDLVLQALETNYGDSRQVQNLREALGRGLFVRPSCRCVTWRDDQRLIVGLDPDTNETQSVGQFLSAFVVFKRRSPWLYGLQCRQCGQLWYLAVDSIDDHYYLHRLDVTEKNQILEGRWPDVFDQLAAAWPTPEWLSLYGYATLEEWQAKNADAPPDEQ